MKTDIQDHIGKHAFEIAGLGLAPFRFVGASENLIVYPDGTTQAGGSCDYCGTRIALECHVLSADEKRFKVGCNCIAKVGDSGLMKAYKSSPEYRRMMAAKRSAKATAVFNELSTLISANSEKLAAMPHPHGFIDRKTGNALTFLDQVKWILDHCGASGRAGLLKSLKSKLSPSTP